IKTDHALARALWATGNHDARVLATMIADPGQTSAADLDAWIAEADNHLQADALVKHVAARVPGVWGQAQRWAATEREWTGYAGWELLDLLALQDKTRPDADFLALLQTIEAGIHGSKNRVRYAMNNAVIAIGSRNPTLAVAAKAVAQRIGKVEVDHGDTGCKTPDAIGYIDKMWARKSA
ncbi:MAG: DNA alkylation repair protein, partial [Chloroflexota bacterium]|nr:DNA alkylation repair protein [Chloroflexota bacterium]